MSAATSFQVSLTKNGPLGMGLNQDTMKVTLIKADGGLAKYNESNPESQVKIGDCVLTINGEKASMDILAALKDGDAVALQFDRPPPLVGSATKPDQPEGDVISADQPKGDGISAATSFQVSLTKNGPLGMGLDQDTMKVTSIKADGGLAKYNESNPESQVKIGDCVLNINGEKASMDILAALKDGDVVALQFERPTAASAPKPMSMEAAPAAGDRPKGVPAEAQFVHEKYVGQNTTIFAVGGCLCCGCLACAILLCPIDEREVWKMEDASGKKWTKDGVLIQ